MSFHFKDLTDDEKADQTEYATEKILYGDYFISKLISKLKKAGFVKNEAIINSDISIKILSNEVRGHLNEKFPNNFGVHRSILKRAIHDLPDSF